MTSFFGMENQVFFVYLFTIKYNEALTEKKGTALQPTQPNQASNPSPNRDKNGGLCPGRSLSKEPTYFLRFRFIHAALSRGAKIPRSSRRSGQY